MRDERTFLADMLEAAERVQRYLAGKTYDQFLNDEPLQDAVLWRLAVIGEAGKKISSATQAAMPALPFDKMAQMRDRIAHGYWKIDYLIVWVTATKRMPELIEHVKAHLASASGEGSTS